MTKNTINEATPAIVGKDTMVKNAQAATQPSPEQVANVANGTLGGTDAIANDARMFMDWSNGNGPYGTAGRDFTYSLSALSLVNPAAAGAVLGVIGAGAVIYGIATSTYIRAVRTKKRLKKIYKGVVGDGYKTSIVGSFIFGMFGGSDKDSKLGWMQFQNQLVGAAETINKFADARGIKPQTLGSWTPKELKENETVFSKILSISYKNLYIPEGELNSNSEYYKKIIDNAKWKWSDAAVIQSYESIVKKMHEQTINAPIAAQKESYKKRIKDLGDNAIKGFETKLSYSLKKGNERTIRCLDGLKSYWESKMEEVDNKLDDAILNVFETEEYKKAKSIVDAIYKVKSDVRLSPEMMEKEFTMGSLFMYQKSPAPILLRLDDFDYNSAMDGELPLMVCNTDITTGKGLYVKVPVDMLSKAGTFDRMGTIERQGTSKTMVKGAKYMTGGPEEGRVYALNYSFASAITADMLRSYAYVCGIKDDPANGKKYVLYVYINNGIGRGISGGLLQMMEYNSFSSRIYGEVTRMENPKKNESALNDTSGELILEKSLKDLFKRKKKEEPEEKHDNAKEEEKEEPKVLDNREYVEIDEVYSKLSEYAFVPEGTYSLGAKGGAIVRTGDITKGSVIIVSKTVDGLTQSTIKEWAELLPAEVPYLEDSDIDYSMDALLDNNDATLDNLAYPLTYGQFAKYFMDPKYSAVYEQIIYNHKDELMDYILEYNKDENKYSLSERDGDGGQMSLIISKNFTKYLNKVIPNEIFLENDHRETEEGKNESCHYEDLTMLRESYFNDYSKVRKINEANNTARTGASDFFKLLGVMIQNGYDKDSIDKYMSAYMSGQFVSGGNNSNTEEAKPVENIPEIIPTVCKEIMDSITGYRNKRDEGGVIAMFKAGPKAMAVKKSVYDEIINSDIESNGIGVVSVENNDKREKYSTTFNNVKDDEVAVLFVGPVDSIDVSDEGKKQKVCDFKSDDKTFSILSTSKLLSTNNFRLISSIKGSDQENVDDQKKYGIEVGSIYYVNRAWFDNARVQTKNESQSFSSEFGSLYKLNEAEESEDRILVSINSIYSGKAKLSYADAGGDIRNAEVKLDNFDTEANPEIYNFDIIKEDVVYTCDFDIISKYLVEGESNIADIKKDGNNLYIWGGNVSKNYIDIFTSGGLARVPVLTMVYMKGKINPDETVSYMLKPEAAGNFYKISSDNFNAVFGNDVDKPKVSVDDNSVIMKLNGCEKREGDIKFNFTYKTEDGNDSSVALDMVNMTPAIKFEMTQAPAEDTTGNSDKLLKTEYPVISKEYMGRLSELKDILRKKYLEGNPDQINIDISNYIKGGGNPTYRDIGKFNINALNIGTTNKPKEDIENIIRLIDSYNMHSPSWLTKDISMAQHLIYNDGKNVIDIPIEGGKGAKNAPRYSEDKKEIIVTGSSDAGENKGKEIILDANNPNYILSECEHYSGPRLIIDEIKYKKHFLYGTPLNEAYTIFVGGGSDKLFAELNALVGTGKPDDFCLLNILKKSNQLNMTVRAGDGNGNLENHGTVPVANNPQNNNPSQQSQNKQQQNQ